MKSGPPVQPVVLFMSTDYGNRLLEYTMKIYYADRLYEYEKRKGTYIMQGVSSYLFRAQRFYFDSAVRI